MKISRLAITLLSFFLDMHIVKADSSSAPSIKEQSLELIKEHVQEKINYQDLDLKIDNWSSQWNKQPIKIVKLEELDIENEGKRFKALINFDGNTRTVTGRMILMSEIPTLKKPISPHDVISEADIIYTRYPCDKIGSSIITSKAELIGKTARHNVIKVNTPIHQSDLQKPILIRKGDVVQITYNGNSFSITNRGFAQADGSYQDTITFEVQSPSQNTAQKKIIYAKVTGPAQAEVAKA